MAQSSTPARSSAEAPHRPMKMLSTFRSSTLQLSKSQDGAPIFDIPITYNARVKFWIRYYQTTGRKWFRVWLERLPRYLPQMQAELRRQGLPQDLAYIAMIESGFSAAARSHAEAVGPWQFIAETGARYGLRSNWWLDERRDFDRSTLAASRYLRDLYKMFQSWYLVAASYNTGENRIKRIIERYRSRDFWFLARRGALNEETLNYVPKLLAATLIAKAPALYGFRDLREQSPVKGELVHIRGGVALSELAQLSGVPKSLLSELNPSLLHGHIPAEVEHYPVRVPHGTAKAFGPYLARAQSRLDKRMTSSY